LANGRRYAPNYDATLDDYLQLLDAHDIGHAVLVQPSFLGTDNRYLLQALSHDTSRLRGVAVVSPEVSEEALSHLHEQGITGVRLNLVQQALPDLCTDPWAGLLQRLSRLGLHVELHREAKDLAPMIASLLKAGLRVVVDHFGRPDPVKGTKDPGFKALLGFGDSGRVWVKLSGAYRCAKHDSNFVRDATTQLLDRFGARRLMWGSDWPHTQYEHVTGYGMTLSTLLDLRLEPAIVDAVLCETTYSFYRFEKEPADNNVPIMPILRRAS
jgi:predicted TIM-barrel fold metal-dependent hydrolase